MTRTIRQFRAETTGGQGGCALIEAASFEEAALVFTERWSGPGEEVRVTLRDRRSGEQHCFTLHLDGELTEGC